MTLYGLPDEVTGYPLDDKGSFWTVVVPEETENLMINPTFDTETGYTFEDITHSLNQDHIGSGVYGLKLTPTFGLTGVVAGNYKEMDTGVYTFSLDIYHEVSQTYTLQVQNSGGTPLQNKTFTTDYTGWGRYSITYKDTAATGSGATRYAVILSSASNRKSFWTDRWQVEKKPYPTTYCDGDLRDIGPNADPYAYIWLGKPHASKSRRSARTDSGGRMVSLWDEIKFRTTNIVGLGLNVTTQETATYADGSEYVTRTYTPAREFSVVGKIYANSPEELDRRQQKLIDYLNPNRRRSGSLILRYQPINQQGDIYGTALNIPCSYIAGLEGSVTNYYQNTIELRFKAPDPMLTEDFKNGSPLNLDGYVYDYTLSGGSAYTYAYYTGMAERDPNTGKYSALRYNASSNGVQRCAIYLPDGRLVVGGFFSQLAGIVANSLAVYDPTTRIWTQFAGGLNGEVKCLAMGQGPLSNCLIAGGTFTATVSSAVTVRRLAYYDITNDTWHEMAGGLNNTVYAVYPYPDGNVFVGGSFNLTGLGSVRKYWTRWNYVGNNFTDLGASGDGPVYTIVSGPGGKIYAGGDFSTFGPGVIAENVIQYDPITGDYDNMAYGLDDAVNVLAFSPDGTLYAGGSFANSSMSLPMTGLAKYRGNAWEGVGNSHIQVVYSLAFDKRGMGYIGGSSGVIGDFESEYETVFYAWNGSEFIPFCPIAIVGVPGDIVVGDNGKVLFLGGGLTDMHFPGYTRIYYSGTGDVRPILQINAGSGTGHIGQLYSLSNYTTNTHIFFKAVGIFAYDVVTLELSQDGAKLLSRNRGDISDQMYLSASDFSKFRLVPGYNDISLMVHVEGSTGLRAFLTWENKHASIEVARGR